MAQEAGILFVAFFLASRSILLMKNRLAEKLEEISTDIWLAPFCVLRGKKLCLARRAALPRRLLRRSNVAGPFSIKRCCANQNAFMGEVALSIFRPLKRKDGSIHYRRSSGSPVFRGIASHASSWPPRPSRPYCEKMLDLSWRGTVKGPDHLYPSFPCMRTSYC